MFDLLYSGFRRLFLRSTWEDVIDDEADTPQAIELIATSFPRQQVQSSAREVELRSDGGQTVRVSMEPGFRWPAEVEIVFEQDWGLQVESLPLNPDWKPLSGYVLDDRVFRGRPLDVLGRLSEEVLAKLRVLIQRPVDRLEGSTLRIGTPHPDLADELLARVRAALTLADVLPSGPPRDHLAERLDQRQDPVWGRLCIKAIAAVGSSDPGFPLFQQLLMRGQPESAVEAATLNLIHARTSLHADLKLPEHRSAALAVLVRLPADTATAARIRPFMDLELALSLLERSDGFLRREALAVVNEGLGEDPDKQLVVRLSCLVDRLPAHVRDRVLVQLAAHVVDVPPAGRASVVQGILRTGDEAAALQVVDIVVQSLTERPSPIRRGDAHRLLSRLPEHPAVDRALDEGLKGGRMRNDVVFAVTQRLLNGRSLGLVPRLTALARTSPRPAADDLIAAIGSARLDGAAPILVGFLKHPDPEIVQQAALRLRTVGGHDEVREMAGVLHDPDTPESLVQVIKSAMLAIEMRVGALERGGLSLVTEGGGQLALANQEGELALEGGGELAEE